MIRLNCAGTPFLHGDCWYSYIAHHPLFTLIMPGIHSAFALGCLALLALAPLAVPQPEGSYFDGLQPEEPYNDILQPEDSMEDPFESAQLRTPSRPARMADPASTQIVDEMPDTLPTELAGPQPLTDEAGDKPAKSPYPPSSATARPTPQPQAETSDTQFGPPADYASGALPPPAPVTAIPSPPRTSANQPPQVRPNPGGQATPAWPTKTTPPGSSGGVDAVLPWGQSCISNPPSFWTLCQRHDLSSLYVYALL